MWRAVYLVLRASSSQHILQVNNSLYVVSLSPTAILALEERVKKNGLWDQKDSTGDKLFVLNVAYLGLISLVWSLVLHMNLQTLPERISEKRIRSNTQIPLGVSSQPKYREKNELSIIDCIKESQHRIYLWSRNVFISFSIRLYFTWKTCGSSSGSDIRVFSTVVG